MPEFEQTFEQTREDVHLIKNEITSMKLSLTILRNALVGSELAADGGLIQRIKDLESELLKMQVTVLEMEKRESKRSTYINIIWALISGSVSIVGTIVIEHFLNK